MIQKKTPERLQEKLCKLSLCELDVRRHRRQKRLRMQLVQMCYPSTKWKHVIRANRKSQYATLKEVHKYWAGRLRYAQQMLNMVNASPKPYRVFVPD